MSVLSNIENAKDAQYITDILRQSGRKFNAGMPDYLPRLIYCARKSIEWVYDQDPNEATLIYTSNYLMGLTVKYWKPCASSTATASGGGSGVAPTTPAPSTPNAYDFKVTGSSFIIAGQSTKTINNFIGFEVSFFRNGISQNTTSIDEGTYYSWNRDTGLFQVFGAAISGELFRIVAQ